MSTSPSSHPVDRPTAGGRPRRARVRRAVAWLVGASCLAGSALWLGLRVQPAPLPTPSFSGAPTPVVALPQDLPPPVERFYRALYGDEVPVVDTLVVSGRGTMRVAGITFPCRYRFSHLTGRAYRHDIETTLFGAPVLSVDERYVEGAARLELPFGVSEGPQVDQGANLALWAELIWAPSVWATSPAIRWEPVDATTARLVVPFGEASESFTVSFDPTTGLLRRLESLRYKGEQAATKTLWINEVREWGQLDGQPVPVSTAVRWGDERSAWAVLRTEQVLHDADLSAYVRADGPAGSGAALSALPVRTASTTSAMAATEALEAVSSSSRPR